MKEDNLKNNYSKYENPRLVELADEYADTLLKEEKSNKYRDYFFPKVIDLMGLKIGAEIGTDKGAFALHLLDKSRLSKLHCIDPWIDDFGSDHRPGFFNKDGNVRLNEAASTLKKHIDDKRCMFHRGFSLDVSKEWSTELDFVYIDGDHSLEGIYTDLYAWVPFVKLGGIVSGHDYKDGPKSGMKNAFGGQLPFMVKSVVDNFCDQYGFKLNVAGGVIKNWWFVKNK